MRLLLTALLACVSLLPLQAQFYVSKIAGFPASQPMLPQSKNGPQAGPFSNGGNLYVVGGHRTASGSAVYVYKSTDGGATWSTPVDDTHAPQSGGSLQVPSYSATQSGTDLYVAWFKYNNVTGTPWVHMDVFHMSTDLWGSDVTGVDTNLGAFGCGFSNGGFSEDLWQLEAANRGDGNVVVAYVANPGATCEADFIPFNIGGSSFGSNVRAAQSSTIDYTPVSLYVDPSFRSYLILVSDSAMGVLTAQAVVLNSSNSVVSGPSIISSNVYVPSPANSQPATAMISGGYSDTSNSIIVVARTNSTGKLAISYAPMGNSPTWTNQDSTLSAYTDNSNFNGNYPAPQMAQAFPMTGGYVGLIYYDNGTGSGVGDANIDQANFNPSTNTWSASTQLLGNALGFNSQGLSLSISGTLASVAVENPANMYSSNGGLGFGQATAVSPQISGFTINGNSVIRGNSALR